MQEWLGGWYPAEVEGSDPKAMDEIGRGEKTFIKVGAFTFEAVQFALKPGAQCRYCAAFKSCQPPLDKVNAPAAVTPGVHP